MTDADWDAIDKVDPDAKNRYGYRVAGAAVCMAHPTMGVAASVCQAKRCRLAVNDWRYVTCEKCLKRRQSGNCRDCKHWGKRGTFTLPGGSTHEYEPPLFAGDEQQCLKLESVVGQDGEPCAGNAHLGTPPDFGCVLFEAKETDGRHVP